MSGGDIHPDGIPIGTGLQYWQTQFLSFHCLNRDCGRWVDMGLRRAVRLAGDPAVRVRAFGRRLRCAGCGHRGAHPMLSADCRSEHAREREGLLKVCLEE